MEWLRCETLQELLEAKAAMPAACIVAGNTEVGIDMHIKGASPAALLDPTPVPELQALRHSDDGLLVCNRVATSVPPTATPQAEMHECGCRLAGLLR